MAQIRMVERKLEFFEDFRNLHLNVRYKLRFTGFALRDIIPHLKLRWKFVILLISTPK